MAPVGVCGAALAGSQEKRGALRFAHCVVLVLKQHADAEIEAQGVFPFLLGIVVGVQGMR